MKYFHSPIIEPNNSSQWHFPIIISYFTLIHASSRINRRRQQRSARRQRVRVSLLTTMLRSACCVVFSSASLPRLFQSFSHSKNTTRSSKIYWPQTLNLSLHFSRLFSVSFFCSVAYTYFGSLCETCDYYVFFLSFASFTFFSYFWVKFHWPASWESSAIIDSVVRARA